MLAIVVNRHTPFAIVILQHQRIVAADPGTSLDPALRHHDSATLIGNGDSVLLAVFTERPPPASYIAGWVFLQVRLDERTDRHNLQSLGVGCVDGRRRERVGEVAATKR